jgi:hypothetical protein
MNISLAKKSLVYVIILLLFGMIFIPGVGADIKPSYQPPDEVYVDDDFNASTPGWGLTHFDKIQDGILAVNVNGTVYVNSGYYYENIGIPKSLNLKGEKAATTIIDGKNVSEVVEIRVDWVKVYGFTITNGSDGIHCSANHVLIAHNIITNNYNWGIMASEEYVVVYQNSIENNGHPTEGTIGSSGGIYLALAFNCRVQQNNFQNNVEVNAFFFKAMLNRWTRNFWDKPRFLPYPIFGIQAIIPPIFWIKVDWLPAKIPHTIP